MADEFDGLTRVTESSALVSAKRETRVARLVCRLYRSATPALRWTMLACLLRPLGTLATVGVAAGAFGGFLYRGGADGARAAMSDVARFTNEQVHELARFAAQVSPAAVQELARLIADRPVGMAAFSASAALLLMQALHQADAGRVTLGAIEPGGASADGFLGAGL